MRIPNTLCDNCSKEFYKRPRDKRITSHNFCSKSCYGEFNRLSKKICLSCLKEFQPKHREQKTCSKSCSTKISRKPWSTRFKNAPRSKNESRLQLIVSIFNIKSCCIDGCGYNKTYDVHRFIKGQDGGKYEIGNMFAICPNHHAEIHRGIIQVLKINDFILKTMEGSPNGREATC